jgi:uncharacterized protein (DUF1499 family)
MGGLLKKCSYLALLGFPLSVLGTRLGLFDFRVGFVGVRYTVYLSIAVFVLGLIIAFWHRKSKPISSKSALWAVLISAIPLLGIGSQMMTAKSVPPIHNISTDIVNPPKFAKIAEIRAAEDNPLAYDIDLLAKVQQDAYPGVKTILSQMNTEEAIARSAAIAQKLGWELVSQDVQSGVLEATETTMLWGFKDDVVIRITAQAEGVAIDLRSVSRVGQSDLGANARRIEAFISHFGE